MKLSILLIVILFPCLAYACPDFYGEWASSKELTMSFNRRWANIEERAMSLLNQTTGTATVNYLQNELVLSDIPSRKITINGEQFDWNGTNQTVHYEVLGCTEKMVSIKYRLFDNDFIVTLNFQADDIYWVYSGHPELTENAHTREYFERGSSPDNAALNSQPTAP